MKVQKVTISRWQVLIWLALFGGIVYGNGLLNAFLGDDLGLVVNNPAIHSILNLPVFFRGGSFYGGVANKLVGVYYKPVTTTFLSLIYTYFGPQPAAFHLAQLLLHILNSWLLFLVFSRFFKKPLSFMLALVFLVHPLNSEAVLYIAATQDVLFFLFGILALLLLVTKFRLLPAIPLLVLALLAKETGLAFLVLAVAYIFLYRKPQVIFSLAAFLLIFFGYVWLRFKTVGIFVNPANTPLSRLTFGERIINLPQIFLFYIKTFIFPIRLASAYHWVYKTADWEHFLLPLIIDLAFLIVIIIGALILRLRKAQAIYFRIYLFFSFWFSLGIFLHLQILPLDAIVAERWFYFPMSGILGMIGAIVAGGGINLNRKLTQAIFFFIIILLATRTFTRTFNWRDYFTLATKDIVVSPQAYDLENVIGVTYLQRNELGAAKAHLEKSIQLYPNFQNYNNLGLLYFQQGDYALAKKAFEDSLSLGEVYTTYENLAVVGLAMKDHQNNIVFINEALVKLPQSAKLWTVLAIEYYYLNQFAEAATAISKAYQYDQSSTTGYYYNAIIRKQSLQTEIGIQ